jgi:hypothetical protein
MRESLTVVLERNTLLCGNFATEPYEAAWASEARWFVRVLDLRGSETRLEARTQISPDGLHWCDLDERSLVIRARGIVSLPVREFGGWLRLKGSVATSSDDGEEVGVKVLIYLALKS